EGRGWGRGPGMVIVACIALLRSGNKGHPGEIRTGVPYKSCGCVRRQPVGCVRAAAPAYDYTLDHLLPLKTPRGRSVSGRPSAGFSPSCHVSTTQPPHSNPRLAMVKKIHPQMTQMAQIRQNRSAHEALIGKPLGAEVQQQAALETGRLQVVE